MRRELAGSTVPSPDDQRQIFPDDRRAGQRGDLGAVVGGRDLDDVHADEVQVAEPAQDRLRLPARQSADLRRAGARRERRIERIDIEREIARACADDLADALRDRRRQPASCTSCAVRMVTPLASVQSCTSRSTGERMPIWIMRRGSTRPSSIAW